MVADQRSSLVSRLLWRAVLLALVISMAMADGLFAWGAL